MKTAGPSKTLLQPAQRMEMENQLGIVERQLSDPYVQDKAAVASRFRRMKHDLETQSPPELRGGDLDVAVRRRKELEGKIREGMLSFEEMRANPPGAVARNQEWHKRNKLNVLEWKNLQLTIDRENTDPELTSVERLRPRTNLMNLDNSQVQTKHFSFPSEAFKQGHDRAFGGDSAEGEISEVQVDDLRREIAEMREKLAALSGAQPDATEKKPRKPMSEEAKQHLRDKALERVRLKRLEDESKLSSPEVSA